MLWVVPTAPPVPNFYSSGKVRSRMTRNAILWVTNIYNAFPRESITTTAFRQGSLSQLMLVVQCLFGSCVTHLHHPCTCMRTGRTSARRSAQTTRRSCGRRTCTHRSARRPLPTQTRTRRHTRPCTIARWARGRRCSAGMDSGTRR